jgi:hypothetical protein
MTANGSDILQTTLAGLETGLRVRHITTYALDTCRPDDDVQDVLADERLKDFDCIPVRDGGSIVGYVQREPHVRGRAHDQMRSIVESVLVSADLPLTQFMPLVPERPFRLVLDGATIRGIVTWSDLQKLPVRLFVFSLVAHLELLMTRVINSRCPNPETWFSCLSPARQGKVRQDFKRFQQERLDPPLIEFTSFGDKRQVLKEILSLDAVASTELLELNTELRDKVSHAGGYAETPDAVRNFARRLALAMRWIEQLTPSLEHR